jgi:UDP-2,3-diacylglucosamine pyrophosphatase LpxH
MSIIAIISDLHLTENKYDRYRWEVWPWIRNILLKHNCEKLYILGDLLDKKDRHPAELVNELIDEISATAIIVPITILKGNHDYLKPDHPFIKFIRHIPKVTFITEPGFTTKTGSVLWLPHSKNPEEEWKDINFRDKNLTNIFMHQSVIGSQVSNYHEMKSGLSTTIFKNTSAKIISGDIHVPQDIPIVGAQPLTYVGTPYPIAFGDTYKPRGLLLDENNKFTSIYMNTIQKLHLKITDPLKLKDLTINREDQVKITLQLSNAELSDWPKYKKEIQDYLTYIGAILRDIKLEKLTEETSKKSTTNITALRQESPLEILNRYSKQEKLDERILAAGLEIINEHTPANGLQQHSNTITQRQQRTKL